MIDNSYSRSYVEVLKILEHIPEDEYRKIPKEKIEFYKRNKDKDYVYEYDVNNISKRTYAIIINLYKNYIATNEEKEKIDDILRLNSLMKKQKNSKS